MTDDAELASPFDAATFTKIPNYILDRVMPELSPGAWKLLTVLLRATIGFQDGESGERLREDVLSYRQLMARSGIGSENSIFRAVNELLEQRIITRRPARAKRSGLVAPPFIYALNERWLVPADELRTAPPKWGPTAAISAPDDSTDAPNAVATAAVSALATAAVSALATAAVSAETKETPKTTDERESKETSSNLSPLSHAFIERWPSIREDLRGQMDGATFAQYFWNAQPLPTGNGQIRLAVRSEWEADWIRLRLYRPLLASLRSFLGEELRGDQVEIVALAAEQDHTDVVSGLTERAVTGKPMEQLSGS